MVVAVRLLGLAARADDVDLRGDLVARAEPGRRRQRDDVVGVVGDERLRVADRELLQRVPDPAVGARRREVVAGRAAGGRLVGDDLVEDGGHPVDHRVVGERALEDDHARTVGERADQLGADVVAAGLGRDRRAEPVGVVDQHVLSTRSAWGYAARSVVCSTTAANSSRRTSAGVSRARGGDGGAGHGTTLAPRGPSRPTRTPQERLRRPAVAEVRAPSTGRRHEAW